MLAYKSINVHQNQLSAYDNGFLCTLGICLNKGQVIENNVGWKIFR